MDWSTLEFRSGTWSGLLGGLALSCYKSAAGRSLTRYERARGTLWLAKLEARGTALFLGRKNASGPADRDGDEGSWKACGSNGWPAAAVVMGTGTDAAGLGWAFPANDPASKRALRARDFSSCWRISSSILRTSRPCSVIAESRVVLGWLGRRESSRCKLADETKRRLAGSDDRGRRRFACWAVAGQIGGTRRFGWRGNREGGSAEGTNGQEQRPTGSGVVSRSEDRSGWRMARTLIYPVDADGALGLNDDLTSTAVCRAGSSRSG